ncbi:hypothetical protein PUR71_02235 [Streptomyces sp. SP17BM10]|uniref:hypothetical protein n=1 Tax=Streptomyces sp. SP17BM10 TaxID=3002530 RepID=UPI002E788B00|nr:hypothetical protein [Streptomyces sp. SP17BM10]MEE1781755.1 hypothetical protein [Streptomyces sp. SP17BM10]
MTRKRKKRTPARCVADAVTAPRPRQTMRQSVRRPRRPRWPWGPGPVETVVIVVVVTVVVAAAAVLVEAGLSAQAALELATGGLLLGLRLRRERA